MQLFHRPVPGGHGADVRSPTGPPRPHRHHTVQFYDDERVLQEAVTRFLGEGMAAGEPILAIAVPERLAAILEGLGRQGFDVAQASREGRLTLLDAQHVLSSFMEGDVPDPERFRATLGGVIQHRLRRHGGSRMRAYGEMVDVLWKQGREDGALLLEDLWNDLARTHSFSLLCAHALDGFCSDAHAERFRAICAAHGRVELATPPASDRLDGATLRVRLLQQRVGELERELAQRKEVERALRRAVTERKRTEAALREAKAEAEQARRAKSEFLAVMSHELRTPLNVIVGYQDLLIHELSGPLTPDQRTYLGRIRSGADQLLGLIEQLLSLTGVQGGTSEPVVEPVDAFMLARDTAAMVEQVAAGKGVALRVHEPAEAIVLDTDPALLRQVLLNLLSNAVKFTERGSVDVRLERNATAASISVADTGQGVPAGEVDRIFQPFVQLSRTAGAGGTGLGLPVSRRLAQLLGGTVTVSSTPGQGSRFTLVLPLRSLLGANGEAPAHA